MTFSHPSFNQHKICDTTVSFLIDPQSDFQNPSVWAIEVSDAKPVYGKESNHFTVSLKQWKNETADFLNFLSQIRSNAK